MTISAAQFPEVYATLGIKTDTLGCIMLDIEPLALPDTLDAEDLYYSMEQEFVQGDVVGHAAHATLLFGLLPMLHRNALVDMVLEGWEKPNHVDIESIGVFPGKEEDGTEYSCIVAHLDPAGLVEANSRLRLLPHIDTFPEYRAHMTLAYVKAEATTEWVETLSSFVGKLVKTTELNYGG